MSTEEKKIQKISQDQVVNTSFAVDISDVVVNVAVAFLSGSATMAAQALKSCADLVSSGFLVIGTRKAKQKADDDHPFGYGREIYFWTFLALLGTFSISATLSIYWGLQQYINPEPINNLYLTYGILTFAFFTNMYALILSQKRLIGNKKNTHFWRVFTNSTLIETKTTYILNLVGSLASVLGLTALIIYKITGNAQYDGIGAITVGLMLVFFSIFILKDVKNLLVGQAAPKKAREEIKQAVLSFNEVNEIFDLRTVLIGSEKMLISLEVNLKDSLATNQIEILIDKIENKIRENVPSAHHIHVELEAPDEL